MKRHEGIFNNINTENIEVSNHFHKRWNQRVGSITFDRKSDFKDYIVRNLSYSRIQHLYKDQYFIDDLMGGIYITAVKEDGKVLLVTTLGKYKNNPMLINIIQSGKLTDTIKRYGKLNLEYVS